MPFNNHLRGAPASEFKAMIYASILSEATEAEKSNSHSSNSHSSEPGRLDPINEGHSLGQSREGRSLGLVHASKACINPSVKLGFVERLQFAIEEHTAGDDRQ